LATALKRQELTHCLLIPIPGPKMIWQFGELGYDYSINHCENGTINASCRTAPKPIHWEYYSDPNRLHLYKVTAALNQLKKNYQTFSTNNYTLDGSGKGKRLILNGTTMDAVVVGNFDVISINMIPGFTHSGTWYDYFTGEAINVTNTAASFSYAAGEYHLYTDQPLPLPDLISCATYNQPCDDGDANTIGDVINEVCVCEGTALIAGCMDIGACNYNVQAAVDDGSCAFPGDACDDENVNTVNDVYDSNCLCAGTVGVEENLLAKAVIYPNPTLTDWNIQFPQNVAIEKVQLMDFAGRLVWEKTINQNTNQIIVDGNQLSNGLYTIRVMGANGMHFNTTITKK
jgi:hypothetical protein